MSRRKTLRSLVLGLLAGLIVAALVAVLFPSQEAKATPTPYIDYALSVNRSSPVIITSSYASLITTSNSDFTVETWAKSNSSYATNTKYVLWRMCDKTLYVYNGNFYYKHDNGTVSDTGVVAPGAGEWFHVAIVTTYSTKTVRLVLNGTSTPWSQSYATMIYYNGGFIGGDGNVASPYDAWNGLIDQVKVYSVALSDSQVQQSMNAFSNVGVSTPNTLTRVVNFNDSQRLTNQYDGQANYGVLPSGGNLTYVDVKTVDTTSRPGKTIFKFPRTYLNAEGGWKPSSSYAATYEYLVVAGGGGGGGNRGGGGGAGGLRSGNVLLPYNGAFQVVVGTGGYSAASGNNSFVKNLNGTSEMVGALGGGAGGTHTGTANGATGGSGGGASLCGLNLYPTGGSGTAGQGYDGATSDPAICGDRATPSDPYPRSTGGGGGSSAAGVLGKGTTSTPTATTSGDIRPNGGAGTANSISGTATTYAAGGGGAIALGVGEDVVGGVYASSYFGLGGSSIGGDGAAVGARGANAAAGTGSGGGGGGATTTNALTSGGYGSAGVIYLVATPGATLTTPAGGATLNAATVVQPTITVPSGTASVTACSAVDANGSSAGVTVSCTATSSAGASVTLTDLTFTSGTANTWYTLVFTISGFDEIRQEIYLGYIPENLSIVASSPSTNFIWDGNSVVATLPAATVSVLASDVQTHLNAGSTSLFANTKIVNSSAVTGTTNGNGLLFKARYFDISSNITTQNGPITFWNTNPNSANGATAATGFLLNSSGTSFKYSIKSNGGDITIGGGSNPATQPLTAEVGVKLRQYSTINAGGGNISIRANSVVNTNLMSANFNMVGAILEGSSQISTTGTGNVNIVVSGTGNSVGNSSGLQTGGFIMTGGGNTVTTVDGSVSISATNTGAGNYWPISVGVNSGDNLNAISATGTGNVTLSGDGSGSTTVTTPPNSTPQYGVSVLGTTNTISTVSGDLTITGRAGNVQAHQTVSNVGSIGVQLTAAKIQATGTGNVTINGTGGNIGFQSQSGKYTNAYGVSTSSFISTTTGTLSVTGTSGSSGGVASISAGVQANYTSSLTQNPGTIMSTTGAINISGDSGPTLASTTVMSSYGIAWNGHKFKSTGGNISLSGSACSACTSADPAQSSYGVYMTTYTGAASWNEATTTGAGTITITGHADHGQSSGTNRGVSISGDSATRSSLNVESGNLTLSGTAGLGNTVSGVYIYTTSSTTTSGDIVVNGTVTPNSNTLQDEGISISGFNGLTDSGDILLTGVSNGTSGTANGIKSALNSSLKTATGAISLDGRVSGSTTGVNAGLQIVSTTISSGSSVTPTTGGPITLFGLGTDRTGQTYETYISDSTIDTYNNSVSITGGQTGSIIESSSRAAVYLNGTSTFGATASAVNITAYGPTNSGKTSSLYLADAAVLNLGGTASSAAFTLNVDGIQRGNVTAPTINIDTTGDVTIRPILASFSADNPSSSTWATDAMRMYLSPTSRVRNLTIGKSGNTKAITFINALNLDSTNGNLVVYGGTVTSTAQITTNTIAVNSSGGVALSNASNTMNQVAIVRGSATGWSVTNTATSWTAGTYSGVTGVYGVPSKFKFSTTQPVTTPANTATSFSVQATDAYDLTIAAANTRSQEALSVTASKVTGASTSLGGTLTQSGTAGASIAFNDITFGQSGNHTIAFDAAGYSQLVSSTINVTNGPPSFTLSYFSGTNSTTFVSSSTTASAALTTSSTGAKTWSVPVGATACSVNSSGVVTTLSAGTCDIRLSTAADANYSAGSITITLTILKANQAALVISTTSGTFGSTMTLSTGSSGSGSGAVSYAVDSGTCSVSGAVLTLGNAGDSCMVTASKAADTSFNAATSASTSIVTNKASQAALSAPSGLTISYADNNGLLISSISITGGSGSGATTIATSTSGCQISSGALTSSNNAGATCSLTATKASDANYLDASITFNVAITKANQATLSITSVSATYGQTLALATSGGTDNGAVTFAVDSGTCSVSGSTLTVGNAGSSCFVTATKAQTTNYNSKTSVSTQVVIAKASQTAVSITSTNSVQYLNTLALTATGGSGTSVGYSFSTATPGCSISGTTLSSTLGATNSCVVAAYKVGDTNYFDSTSVLQTVTITKASQLSALSVPSGVTLVYGSVAGLDLSSLSYTGGEGTGAWTFSTPTSGCAIASTILTSTNNAATTCSISVVKAADANYNASTPQIMTVTISKATQSAITVTTLNATYLANLTLQASGGTTNLAVTFAKISGSCTISGAVLTPTGAGTCVVTATMAGGTNYNDVVSSNTTITIAKANQAALTWSLGSTSVAYLGSLTLATAGGSGTGAVVYTVGQGSTCSVGGNVLMPGDAGSLCEVVATKVADSNYNSVDTATQVFTVTKIAQAAISFTNASVMTYGQTLNVMAVGGSGNGAIAYSVSNPGLTGCSLAGTTLSVTAAGTCVVSATKATSTNYLVGSAVTQSITVNKASQTAAFTSTVPPTPIVGDTYVLSSSSSSGTAPTYAIGSGGCSIVANTVTFTGAGACRIDLSLATTSQYLASTVVSQTISVGQRNQTLTFDAATLAVTGKTFGDQAFLAAASSSVGSLSPVFSRGANTTNNACLVTTSGLVTIVAVGLCEIQADQPGDADTAAASTIVKSFNVVADIANAPTIVSISSGHQSITLAFVRPSYTGGAPITGFKLVATHAGGQVSYDGCSVVAGTDQSCTINGLTNGSSYTVKVAAINSAGVGLQSAASSPRIPATNPAAVSAFTAVPDDTRLVLSWQNPVSLGGGTFDSYRIFIKRSTDASYPVTYITVNSQSVLTYTVSGLINGEAYDAKIVTVTTANTLALESNTAEARETPRTVPDAPATIQIFEVGSNLVISWTSPIFDGGNSISEFAVSIAGVPCVLATPLDTTCEVTKPTAPGSHPIEVKAKNAAGFGLPIATVFSVASAQPPAGSIGNGGNEYVTNPRIPMLVLGLSSGKVSTAGGQILTLTTKNMSNLTEVTVDGVKVKILSKSATQVKLQMPKHAAGPITIRFVSPNGSLDFVGVTYASSAAAASSGKVVIRNFIQENATLSATAKASLRAALAANPGTKAVTCIGYQSWSYDRALDAQTALQRAQAACNYLKSIKKSLVTKTAVARTSLTGPASRKLEVLLRESR